MKTKIILLTILMSMALIGGCKNDTPKSEAKKSSEPTQATEALQPAAEGGFSGTVAETMNTAGYTYVLVDTGSGKSWAAAPEMQIKVGDKVIVPPGAPMYNYHSSTLNRDFELVYFVGRIMPADGAEQGAAPQAAPGATPEMAPGQSAPQPKLEISKMEKAAGGKSVAEIWAEKDKLAGQKVLVRGMVVKYNQQIMGKNWLHIQDGTGKSDDKTDDLAVTSSATANFGDTVLIKGDLALNKDFGYSYQFPVMLENAEITIEKKAEATPAPEVKPAPAAQPEVKPATK